MKTHNSGNRYFMSFLLKNRSYFFIALLLGCSTLEGPEIVSLNPSEIVAKVSINSDFVMIKKGDTLKLGFIAIATDNSIVEVDQDSVRWRSQEPSQVEIDSFGNIVGKITNNIPVRVILSYKHNLNTISDSVLVYVTEDKYEDARIKLVQIDSNTVGAPHTLFSGLNNPRIRVDLYEGKIRIVKGANIPVAAQSPMIVMQFDISGGPEGEPVYYVSNQHGHIGQFWVKSSLNLYGNIDSDSVAFIGQYPVGFSSWVVTDLNGMIVPYSLDPLALAPQIQPCGMFSILNFSSKQIDIVFSDSAELVSGCDTLPMVVSAISVLGGNTLSIPMFGRGDRRISRIGIVSYYIRDAITKERLPYNGRYESITAKK